MREAVIVAAKRTPIGKAYRGAFNNTYGATLAAESIRAVVAQAGVDPAEIDDVAMGCAMEQGTTGQNIARQAALRAGLPNTVSGMTMDRQCSSGLMAIATAAKYIVNDGAPIAIGGGVESISLVQNDKMNRYMTSDPWLREHVPELACSMIETAEIVAERYGVSRQYQDEYALQSQQRTAQAQAEGRFANEIIPVSTVMKVLVNKETGETADKEITLDRDEGNRPQTTMEDLAKLNPVFKGGLYVKEGKYITAGNASQLSDGSAAVLLMERKEAEKRGLEPLGAYRGMAVAGCGPEEMGIGPVFAIPKLLERNGLKIDDIDIWELNEAFASQLLYCRDKLGIPNEKLNVSGEIMLIAQLTAIADVYDALCSDRPFRARLPRELAMSLMRRMAGAQLNGDLLQVFMHVVPIYPTGYPIRIVGGALDRWQGVVAKLGSPDINRPIVRIFQRPDGGEVEPFEVDLAQDSTARLMTAPPKRGKVGSA